MLDDNRLFTVTDLKQFVYCPRILYYHGCLPDIRPITYKMQSGIQRHDNERKHSLRRTMRLDGIEDAQREFDVPVQSESLRLSGQIDEVLLFADHLIVVDYKLARKAGKHFKLQLAAYAALAQDHYGLPCTRGILYLIHKREAVHVTITRTQRQKVADAIQEMQAIIDDERMPLPTKYRRACLDHPR